MKYSLNHHWKFKSPISAVIVGLMQVSSSLLTALVNYAIIVQAPNVLDLAKDFTALLVIASFDDWFAMASKAEIIKDILDKEKSHYADLFKIVVTTSLDARGNKNEAIEDDEGIYDKIKSRKQLKYLAAKERKEKCVCMKRSGKSWKKP